jgi:hypothetical protein
MIITNTEQKLLDAGHLVIEDIDHPVYGSLQTLEIKSDKKYLHSKNKGRKTWNFGKAGSYKNKKKVNYRVTSAVK